jgi:hypothetical protein
MLLILLFNCLAILDLGKFGLCLRAIIINPALVTSDNPGQGCVIGEMTRLLTDVYTLLLLISCQHPGHQFAGDTMHAQLSNRIRWHVP